MPQRIQAPDGSIVEFPDGMGDDQIAAVMRREYGGKDTRPTSQSLGFMEGVARPLENFAKVNPLNAIKTPFAKETEEMARQGMRDYFAKREQTERPGMIGNVVGQVAATVPIMATVRNPFAAGALQGAALTDKDTAGGVLGDMAMGAGLNWAGGKVVDTIADAVQPVIQPAVRRLADAGVKLTPGMVRGGKAMVREDKAMSRPGIGDAVRAGREKTQMTFNTATANKVLSPIGLRIPSNVQPGTDTVQFVKDVISDEYDQVIPNLSVRINPQQFAQNVGQVARNLKAAEQKALQKIVSNELGNGQIAGEALKRAQGEIRRLASVYGRSQNANEQLLGQALRSVDDELTQTMLAQNPQWAPALSRVNQAYKGYRIYADAASRADEGIINTGQLKQAVRRGDRSMNKDANARGAAYMQDFSRDARSVIPALAPNPSGTAAHVLSRNPFANIQGAADAALYNLDRAYQAFRLAPRPAGAAKVAAGVRKLQKPLSGGAVALTHQPRD